MARRFPQQSGRRAIPGSCMVSGVPFGMIQRVVFFGFLGLSLAPFVTAWHALLLGGAVGLALGNPFVKQTGTWSKKLLQLAVILLGFGITIQEVGSVGRDAAVYTFVGISLTLALGYVLHKLIKGDGTTAFLVTVGTSICGGSAIAAVAPVVHADDKQTGVSLATIFTLNAIALLLFPLIGHALGMDQGAFGVWAAMAIHDTSSVVGAASSYGEEALKIGTTVKLTRALWIIPLALIAGLALKSKGKAKFPWFLLGFIAAAAVASVFKDERWAWGYEAGRRVLVVTIFLVGCGLTRDVVKRAGPRPMILGVTLWIIVSVGSLLAIRAGLVPT